MVGASGCGGPPDELASPVAMGQIPAQVVKAAREALPGVQFSSATHARARGVETYAIEGKDPKGESRSVEVRRDGTVVAPK